jgi:hypothetical protein
MTMTAVVFEQPAVLQPKQHGKPGGFLRHTSIFTGLAGGIVLATITYMIGSKLVPWGTQNADFSQVGLNALIAATMFAWVIGFMAGIGAFAGLWWDLGEDGVPPR